MKPLLSHFWLFPPGLHLSSLVVGLFFLSSLTEGSKKPLPFLLHPLTLTHSLSPHLPDVEKRNYFWLSESDTYAIKHFPGVFGEILLCSPFLDAFQADNSAARRSWAAFLIALNSHPFPREKLLMTQFSAEFSSAIFTREARGGASKDM